MGYILVISIFRLWIEVELSALWCVTSQWGLTRPSSKHIRSGLAGNVVPTVITKYSHCHGHFAFSLSQCESLSNLLVEKLDPLTVRVNPPEVVPLHPQRLADLRRETCLLAVHNAKQKAAEIAKHFGSFCSLGPPVSIKEEAVEEWGAEEQVREGLPDKVMYYSKCHSCFTSFL